MDKRITVKAFNEWMRLTIEDPDRFEQQWQTIVTYRDAVAKGEEPDYGTVCTEFLEQLSQQIEAEEAQAKAGTEVAEQA